MRFTALILLGLIGLWPLGAEEESNSIPPEHQTILKEDWNSNSWTPTSQEAAKALDAAIALLRRTAALPEKEGKWTTEKYNIESAKNIEKDLGHYVVQISGSVFLGKKLIQFNFMYLGALDDNELKSWKTKHLCMLGGGAAFWHVSYDPEAQKCLELDINGDD